MMFQKSPCLMDRYYPSLKLFKLCELMGWNYIVRAKSNFFKAERAPHQGEDDFWICRSMKPSDLKSIRKVDDEARKLIGEDEDPVNIRVVRHEMSYITKSGIPLKKVQRRFTLLICLMT